MKIKTTAVILAIAITASAAFTGCKKSYVYTTDDYVSVSMTGADGRASAEPVFDESGFMEKVNADLYGGKADDEELTRIKNALYNAVKVKIAGNAENLSNGDAVSVMMSADNDRLKRFGISFSQDTYIYTVEGLPTAAEIDAFDGLKLEYEGISPHLTLKLSYDGSDDFVKDKVKFSSDVTDNIKNGDKLTISAKADENELEALSKKDSKFYVLKEAEKEFEVSGFDEYLCENTELDELDEVLDDYADYIADIKTDAYEYGHSLFKDGSYDEIFVTTSAKITPVKRVLLYSSAKDEKVNCYSVFYRLNMTAEDINGIKKKCDDIYVRVDMPDVIRKADGTIVFDEDKLDYQIYSDSFMTNFVGAKFEEVYEDYITEMQGYDEK